MRNLRIKTFALLTTVVTVLAATSVYAYYGTVPGIVQVYVTDTPNYSTDVQHIYLTFYKVELHKVQGDGWYQIGGDFFQTIDLKAAINTSLLLSSQQIPQGTYDMVRITLSYAKVVLAENGTTNTYILSLPAELQSGLKISLQGTMTAKAGVTRGVLIDIAVSDQGLHEGVLTPAINARVKS